MIGKPEWFTRRKYTGWGLTPKTWQGWIYIAAIILPFVIFQSLPFWSFQVRAVVTIVWFIFLALDVFHIMIRMKKDERERIHEAIAERNALWAIMLIMAAGVAYQVSRSAVLQDFSQVDWFLVAALAVGLIVKSISNYYLDKHD